MKKTAIAVLLVALAGCGRETVAPTSASHSTTTIAPAAVVPASPAASPVATRVVPAVTTPDLTDVDKALATVDADIAKADRDSTNEGALNQ